MKLSSQFEAKLKIKEAIRYLEPDLEIVTKEGAIILVNRLLLSLSSPLLQNLLTGDISSPDRMHLPDVSAPGLIHLINVVKNGFTTGVGPGYSDLKQIRDVAKVLGFQHTPVLTFEIQRNNREVVEDFLQNGPVESHEGVNGTMDNMAKSIEPGDSMAKDKNKGVDGDMDKSVEPEDMTEDQNESVDGTMDTMGKSMEPGDNMAEDQDEVTDINTDTMDALMEPGDDEIEDGEINIKMEIDEDSDKSPKSIRRPRCIKMGHYSRQKSPSNLLGFRPLVNTNKANQAPESQECELTEERINGSQEVTEAQAKVLKVEVGQEDGDQNHTPDDVPMFPCSECFKRFSNAGSLLVHSEQHEEKTGKKKCPLCHLSGTRTSLLSHIRAKHTKEKLFSCAFCQQLFTTCTSKKKHEKKHSRSEVNEYLA